MKNLFSSAITFLLLASLAQAEVNVTKRAKREIGNNDMIVVDVTAGESVTPEQLASATNDLNNAITVKLNDKQDTINDLATIRSGASAGATAVQPAALNSYYTKTNIDEMAEGARAEFYETNRVITATIDSKTTELKQRMLKDEEDFIQLKKKATPIEEMHPTARYPVQSRGIWNWVTGLFDSLVLPWSSVTNTPTTLAGYGITDAATKTDIVGVRPDASITNEGKLASAKLTAEFVNSSINAIAAFYITSDASGSAFPTHASLTNETAKYYKAGEEWTPKQGDYAIVLKDEDHPSAASGEPASTRYTLQVNSEKVGIWEYQYTINDTPFTSQQLGTLNSGITAADKTKWDALQSNVKSDWNAAAGDDAEILNKPSIPQIDNTLTVSGRAADAKVTGDLIEGLTNGFVELISSPDSPIAAVNASLGKNTVISNFNAKTGEWVETELKDYSVRLGENTRANGNSGGTSNPHTQQIVIGRDARSEGSAAIALGPNSEADGAQSVALGWRAQAIGKYSISIGSGVTSGQNYWTDDAHTNKNPRANGTLAEAEQTIAIGYGAHATAIRAIQLGKGTNSVPNSVKINDTLIFKDGKLVGIDTDDVKDIVNDSNRPKVIDKTVPGPDYEEVTVRSYCINTLNLDAADLDEIAINYSDTRNYELFIPNTESLRHGLPIGFDTDIDGEVLKLGKWWGKKITKLPAKVSVKEPFDKNILIDVEEYDSSWNWTPIVVKATETSGGVDIVGTNLHYTASVEINSRSYEVKNPLYYKVSISASGVIGKTGKLVAEDGRELATFTVE